MNVDQENFIREVDTDLYKLLDAYRSLLKKSQQIDSQQQELQFKTFTAQIAFHSQALLEKISDLRMQVVLSDGTTNSTNHPEVVPSNV
jgi:hypothetical protein